MLPAAYAPLPGAERLPEARFCAGCGWEFDTTHPPPQLQPLPVPVVAEPELLPAAPYPVELHLGYRPHQRRVTAVFRLILALPHLAGWLAMAVLSIALAILAWPLALLLGRLPRPLHRFQSAVLAYVTGVACYLCLVVERWPPPPWSATAGGEVSVAPPQPLPRLRTLLVVPIAIPAVLTAFLFGVVSWMLAIGAWFAILFTGRLPRTIYDMLDLALGFQARTLGYLPLLLTAVYPWFERGPLLLPSRRETGAG